MPPRAIKAQTTRAILLASATRTSIGGLRSNIPASQVRGRVEVPLDDDTVGPDYQQSPDRLLAHLRRSSELLLSARRVLPWCQAEPGRTIPSLSECLGRRRKGRDSRRNQRTDARHHHKTPRHFILLCPKGDLDIKLPDLCLQLLKCRDQHLERGNSTGRKITFGVFDNRDQRRSVGRPRWHDLPKFAQVATQGVNGLCPLSDQKFADT